jgi:hypothetical protein
MRGNIEMDRTEAGWGDVDCLVQDSDQRRSLVNTVKKVFHKMLGKFLSSRETGGF